MERIRIQIERQRLRKSTWPRKWSGTKKRLETILAPKSQVSLSSWKTRYTWETRLASVISKRARMLQITSLTECQKGLLSSKISWTFCDRKINTTTTSSSRASSTPTWPLMPAVTSDQRQRTNWSCLGLSTSPCLFRRTERRWTPYATILPWWTPLSSKSWWRRACSNRKEISIRWSLKCFRKDKDKNK